MDIPGFHLDTRRRVLLSATTGEAVPLSVKAFDLLLVLVERHGEVVSKDELLRLVWPRVVVEENNLERHVSMIRRALGEKPGENRYIATVPGQGYRFVAEVSSQASGEASVAPPRPREPPRRYPIVAFIAVIGLAVAAATAVGLLRRAPSSPVATVPAAAAAPASLAVLPFTNLSGDAGKEYLGDGLAEELIHRLARDARFVVPARTSSFAYKGRNVDLRQVGRDLGVAYVLEGSVRSGAAERVRVTVQLVDAATGYHVWSQGYERPFADVFALQDELAGAIVQRLSPGMQAGGTTRLEAPPTTNMEAYRLFLQANAIAAPGTESFARALPLYDQAIALDPDFARARVARATTHISRLLFGPISPDDFAAAENDARRALELEPGLAAAHAAMAQIEALRANWGAALRGFDKARALDTTDPLILIAHATVMASTGRLQQAAALADEAVRLAPLAISPLLVRAQFHSVFGEDAQATDLIDRAIALGARPDVGLAVFVRSEVAARAGKPREAAGILATMLPEEARAAGAEAALTAVYEGWIDPSKRAAARRAMRDLVARVPLNAFDRRGGTLLMVLHSMTGDLDAAYAAANAALDARAREGTVGTPWYSLWTAPLAGFRADPRFEALTRRLKLPEYWGAAGNPEVCEWRDGAMACWRR